MSRSTSLDTVYATDEDLAVAAGADFAEVCPASNLYASGADGVIASGSLWTLASASNDFAAQGVEPGMVVQLTDPVASLLTRKPQFVAVDTVSSGSLTFRRLGCDAGVGQPPVAAAGLTGVTFKVVSLKPQIENAAYELNEQYAVDPNIAYRSAADLYDKRPFRRLTALWVFYQQYSNVNRTKDGDFAAKADFYRKQYDECLEKAILRWGPTGTTQPPTTRFSTRLSR